MLALQSAVLFMALSAFADSTTALSFTGGTVGYASLGIETAGWSFTLNDDVLLTDLGIWDLNSDGLVDSHKVTIWTSTGVQVAQATVAAGTAATLINGFRYTTLIGGLLLPAGNYVIGGLYPDDPTFSRDASVFQASSISMASGLIYTGPRDVYGASGDAFPTGNQSGFSDSYFGPNFRFTNAPGAGVPDSGTTLGLLALALAGLALVSRCTNADASRLAQS